MLIYGSGLRISEATNLRIEDVDSKEMRLLSNGLSAFATESGTNVQLQMAASTIAIVPILILYLVFRKQIIRGVVKSGVKG